MKFWVLKPNYGGLGAKPPAVEGNGDLGAESPIFGNFCSFFNQYTAF